VNDFAYQLVTRSVVRGKENIKETKPARSSRILNGFSVHQLAGKVAAWLIWGQPAAAFLKPERD
jgi:hypothetical protein